MKKMALNKGHTAKIIVGVMIMFMAISMVSALDFDNIATYTKLDNYGKYEIRNSILGIPFLQLDKQADITLESNTDNCILQKL